MTNQILTIYNLLLKKYRHQGWWPLLDVAESGKGNNPTKTGSVRGYHPKDYSYPKTEAQRFEICTGAILTQNTAWPNVEKALTAIQRQNALSPKKIIEMPEAKLAETIRPAGYYNQKAKKIKLFSKFYLGIENRTPTREELLKVWGIGRETADSILLYAYRMPVFVVDTYTRRIISEHKLFNISGRETEHKLKWNADYDDIRTVFEENLKENLKKDYKIYQEFHALIVEHAKRKKFQ